MKEIVFQSNFAYLYLNKNIYTKNTILDTIKEYSDFILVKFGELGKYYTLRVESKTKDYELNILAYEFLNYLLNNLRLSQIKLI